MLLDFTALIKILHQNPTLLSFIIYPFLFTFFFLTLLTKMHAIIHLFILFILYVSIYPYLFVSFFVHQFLFTSCIGLYVYIMHKDETAYLAVCLFRSLVLSLSFYLFISFVYFLTC